MRWPLVTHRSSAKHGQAGAAHVAAPGIRPGRYIMSWTLQQLLASNHCNLTTGVFHCRNTPVACCRYNKSQAASLAASFMVVASKP